MILRALAWSGVGVGCALIYAGWSAQPRLEGFLRLGFTIVLTPLVVLSLRHLMHLRSPGRRENYRRDP